MTTICCLCNKTKNNNHWEEKPIPSQRTISHGYCPKCFRKVMAQINTYKPSVTSRQARFN